MSHLNVPFECLFVFPRHKSVPAFINPLSSMIGGSLCYPITSDSILHGLVASDCMFDHKFSPSCSCPHSPELFILLDCLAEEGGQTLSVLGVLE